MGTNLVEALWLLLQRMTASSKTPDAQNETLAVPQISPAWSPVWMSWREHWSSCSRSCLHKSKRAYAPVKVQVRQWPKSSTKVFSWWPVVLYSAEEKSGHERARRGRGKHGLFLQSAFRSDIACHDYFSLSLSLSLLLFHFLSTRPSTSKMVIHLIKNTIFQKVDHNQSLMNLHILSQKVLVD